MSDYVIPDHVPQELILDFDYIDATSGVDDPYASLMRLDDKGAADIFFSPRLGGHWIVRRYDDVLDVLRDVENFATYPISIPEMECNDREALIPLQIDPPDHQKYRRAMGPLFTPGATRRMEEIVRTTAIELIEPIVGSGETDFVQSFAHRFPPMVFLRSMGMPTDRIDEFVGWASHSLVGTAEQQVAAGAHISAFISEFVDQKYKVPGDDWTSLLIAARAADGTPLSRNEILNVSFFLFLAGLDTVLNSMTHAWRYLAAHPEEQAKLVANPAAIPRAVDELLRVHAVINSSRRARHDLEFRGIKMKKGDPVLVLSAVGNRDKSKFEGGSKVDLEREQNAHLTFGAGIHRCLGSNLARAELRIAMEEWFLRIPSFHMREGIEMRSTGGLTMGFKSLPLVWEKHA